MTSFSLLQERSPDNVGLPCHMHAYPQLAGANESYSCARRSITVGPCGPAPLLLLGTTNFKNHLDAARFRPGRMQQRISVLSAGTEPEVMVLLRFYLADDLADSELGKLATARLSRMLS